MRWLPRIVAFSVGALSLTQEILWTKTVSFVGHGVPESFAIVLAYFLVGIALGAHIGKRACERSGSLVAFGGLILVAAAALCVASPFLYLYAHRLGFPIIGFAPIIVAAAALNGVLFPIVHHIGSDGRTVGQGTSFSWVYFSNVMGCTVGPLLTALVLLDYLSLQASFIFVGMLTFAVAAYMLLSTRQHMMALVSAALTCASVMLLGVPNLLIGQIADRFNDNEKISHVIETKEGIIHTQSSPDGDIVFGNNVYDGRVSVDLHSDANKIDRAYALALAHGDPRSILVIGMSAGAWTEVFSTFPLVQRIDAIEINPGFVDLIRQYPQVAPILTDPRIHVHIDDGRRWLRRGVTRKFDLIALNTTFFWRSNSTNLLSKEFMELVRSRLANKGVVLVNATGSPDVFNTVASVFPFAYLYRNTVFASDHDFRQSVSMNLDTIFTTTRGGRPVFDRGNALDVAAVQSILAIPFVDLDTIRAQTPRPLGVITDGNMLTEYKYGRGVN